MIIAVGNDHRGYALKKFLLSFDTLASKQITWIDVGSCSPDRTDYPLYAIKAAKLVAQNQAEAAILACGTGTGMAIAANRFKNIYAGVAWNPTIGRLNKEDDNVNVLVLPADYISLQEGIATVEAWLSAEFKEGRYAERITMIDQITG